MSHSPRSSIGRAQAFYLYKLKRNSIKLIDTRLIGTLPLVKLVFKHDLFFGLLLRRTLGKDLMTLGKTRYLILPLTVKRGSLIVNCEFSLRLRVQFPSRVSFSEYFRIFFRILQKYYRLRFCIQVRNKDFSSGVERTANNCEVGSSILPSPSILPS